MLDNLDRRRTAIDLAAKAGFVVVVLLALVGLISVAGRFVMTVRYLQDPAVAATPDKTGLGFNQRYYAHPYLTLVHIVAGFFFMTLGPLQFVRQFATGGFGFIVGADVSFLSPVWSVFSRHSSSCPSCRYSERSPPRSPRSSAALYS
jgi:hypothetical protein